MGPSLPPQDPPPQVQDPATTWIRPVYVLVFIWDVIATLALISLLLFPQRELRLGLTVHETEVIPSFSVYFPTWENLFRSDTAKAVDIEDILAALEAPIESPSKASVDSSEEFGRAADLRQPPNAIQYPNNDPSVLFPVFEALENARKAEKPIRILHYGDSQIEGDRMSSLFRARIQERFGGSGPGLVAAKPLTSSLSVVQETSESMQRYAQYGVVDKSVNHQRYGAMAIFSRFAPIIPDSLYTEKEIHTGWLSLEVSGSAYGTSKEFSKLKLYYGYNRSDVNVKVFVDDVPYADEMLPANKTLKVKTWTFDKTPKKIMLILEGYDSPDLYGLSLESAAGVALDNVSMRGSSGTSFGSLATVPFKPMLDSLNPKLLLLQYGGNTVPYIKDEQAAQGYGRSFKSQIELLKRLVPGVTVIVIGPGDMSTKVEGEMQTYPNLVHVRDALRQAAFDAGACFFDIYATMGGHNSMLEWVGADPPLAASDYVHFSPKGARIIAEAFIKSFLADYEAYHQARIN